MKGMKTHGSFDEYLKDQSPKNQAIIRGLRRLVKRVEPGLSETVKWGNGCWVGSTGPVAYVYQKGCLKARGSTCGIPKSARHPESMSGPLRRF